MGLYYAWRSLKKNEPLTGRHRQLFDEANLNLAGLFLFGHYLESYVEKGKKDHTKIDRSDLNSPCRELSNGGLGIVVTLLVCRKINFSCASR